MPLIHSFVSIKPESSDSTLVSKNEWNDAHSLTGGSAGQIVTYNEVNAPSNFRYIDPNRFGSGSYVIPGSTAPPITDVALVTLNLTTTTYCLCILATHAIVVSGGTSLTVGLRHNTTNVRNFVTPSTNLNHTCFQWIVQGTVGVNNFTAILDAGSNITSGDVFLQVLSVGF